VLPTFPLACIVFSGQIGDSAFFVQRRCCGRGWMDRTFRYAPDRQPPIAAHRKFVSCFAGTLR
jgi:hypothetical protein